MLFVNFKAYQQGTGESALELAKTCRFVSEAEGINIIPAVQTADIFRLVQKIDLPIWAQHVDNISYGAHTGHVLPESVLFSGAEGTILNHSENKLPLEVVKETIKKLREAGLKVLVCCENIKEGKKIAKVEPDFIAYEPPELIGSRTSSVATAKPEIITEFVKSFPSISIIIGAGIHSQEDVQISLSLGVKGILVATDVVLAKNPERELTELARGFE